MNRHDYINTISTLDVYSQASCLGSAIYMVASRAITQAMRIIPDHPTFEQIEQFLDDERNMKLDREYLQGKNGELVALTEHADVATTPGNKMQEREDLRELLGIRAAFMAAREEATSGMKSQQVDDGLAGTLKVMINFITTDPVVFSREYSTNARLGGKNYGVSRKDYVEQEVKKALNKKAVWEGKAELAIQFLEGLDPIENSNGYVPEDLLERICARNVVKLIERRQKVGMMLPRLTSTEARQGAEADIAFIEAAIVEFGGKVPEEVVVAEAEDIEDIKITFDAPMPTAMTPEMMAQVATMVATLMAQQQAPLNGSTYKAKLDTYAPGPVTLSH